MRKALAKPCTTINRSRIQIRVDKEIVENISLCFAKAKLLDLQLAKRTQGFYNEDAYHLLTIVTPTDFKPKPPFNSSTQLQLDLRNLPQNHLGYYPKNSIRTTHQASRLECRPPWHPTAILQQRILRSLC